MLSGVLLSGGTITGSSLEQEIRLTANSTGAIMIRKRFLPRLLFDFFFMAISVSCRIFGYGSKVNLPVGRKIRENPEFRNAAIRFQ
jgi:hypothetical protein